SAIVAGATLLVAFGIWQSTIPVLPASEGSGALGMFANGLEALRAAAFQVVSIVTTTGFVSANFELWPPLATGVLFLLLFVGGMAGSTAGGIKVLRHVLLFKNSSREIRQLIQPQAIIPVRLNGNVVPAEVLRNVL